MSENETPADDLRSILSASYDEAATATAPIEPIAKVEPEAPKAEAAEPEPKAETRERGPDGKFLKKEADEKPEAKAETKDEPKVEAKKEGEEPPADDKEPKAKPDPKEEAISKWSASDKAMFKLQSPEAQDFLLRRHRAMEADYTKKVQSNAELKREFEPIQQMFAPHLDVLKQKGLTPASTIRAWANVETALANGRGVDVVRGMVQSYGIDKAALGRALGFTSTGAAEPSTEADKGAAGNPATNAAHQPIALPPALEQELRDLRARIDAKDNTDRQAQANAAREREAKVETDITNFKSAANDKGELLHPYFEEVEPAMIALASSYAASKQPIPVLADLYETAVWANPSTRAAILASQKQAEMTKQAEEARAKAASARKAGSSVTGAPGSGQATKQIRGELSLREQLEESAADLA
jgi:hypothetical protein